jgi:hypothetical protein
VLGTVKVQTFGSTAALGTQTSIAVSTLSEATYTLQASYSGDDLYAPAFRNLPTGVDVALERRAPTINQVVTAASYLPGI